MKKFIEQEKTTLLQHLQTAFNNRAVNFNFVMIEGEKEDIPLHMKLNSKERFEHMAAQYPLLRTLKEKLKLDIDY